MSHTERNAHPRPAHGRRDNPTRPDNDPSEQIRPNTIRAGLVLADRLEAVIAAATDRGDWNAVAEAERELSELRSELADCGCYADDPGCQDETGPSDFEDPAQLMAEDAEQSRRAAGKPSLTPSKRSRRVFASVAFATGLAAGVLLAAPAGPAPPSPTGHELAAVIAVSPADAYGPRCRTEDSCQPLYRDGQWVVVPIVP